MNVGKAIEYFFFQTVGAIVRMLPLNGARWLGGALGVLVYGAGVRKKITRNNLRNAFPEQSTKECDRIARESFRTIATTLVEFMWFPRLSNEAIRSMVAVKNPELLVEAKGRGKGVVLLTLHFGSWEMFALASSAVIREPLQIIVKTQSNEYVDTEVNRWRSRLGGVTVPMEQSVRHMLKALSNGQVILLAADQTAAQDAVKVNFFGRETPCFEGPAVFALKTGAPLIFGFARRLVSGNLEMEYSEINTADLSGATEKNIRLLTERHVQAAEELIRKYPDQWMWMHRRWKHVVDWSMSQDA
ncbi:MAG: hypothetical protein HY966_06495 [Ignavibacteriales bacterium]|nr:hypothetical protein [Ignavibacteriales bacterium]